MRRRDGLRPDPLVTRWLVSILGMSMVTTGIGCSAPPAATSQATPSRQSSVVTVPFDLYHGFILVSATVDGRHGTFVLDTGSPVIALNDEYLRVSESGSLDTVVGQPATAGGPPSSKRVTAHTARIGTLQYSLDPTDKGPPTSLRANSYLAHDNRFRASGDRPVLGFLGLPALEPFEVIVDYPRKQLTLIRLDTTGQREAHVPRYTVASAIPLVPYRRYWWGVPAVLGDTVSRVLMLDTGAPINMLSENTRARLGTHLQESGTTMTPHHYTDGTPFLDSEPSWTVDRVMLGGQAITVPTVQVVEGTGKDDIFGAPFLSTFGVVGFNFRVHQLLIYQAR